MAHHRQKYNSGPLALQNGHAKRPISAARFSFANVTKCALESACDSGCALPPQVRVPQRTSAKMAEEEMAEGEDYAGAQGDELDDIDEVGASSVPPACLQSGASFSISSAELPPPLDPSPGSGP